jgi:type II secretory pathway pseudopilin PulG
VEVLTVVVIVGIIAMLAIPLLESTDAARVSSAARLIVADMQYAQMYSISHSDNPMGLKFDTSANSYTLVERSGALPFQCSSVTTVTNPVDGEPFTTTFGSGRAAELTGVGIDSVSLDGDECLVFGGFGELDQSSAATIDVSFGGRSLTISIDPITGDATVSP